MAAVGDQQLTVDVEHGGWPGAAAVDGGVLQLEDGVGGVGGAVLVAVDLDGAALGAVEIVQRVVLSRVSLVPALASSTCS